MSAEGKWAFFRQSGWLVIATGISGLFLIAVYSVKLPDLSTFHSMLRLFMVLGVATSGLQVIVAQDAAGAVTPAQERDFTVALRSVARGIIAFWIALALICAVFHNWIIGTLKLASPVTLAVTLALVLAQLFLPFVQGLLQGTQRFSWLGWSIILNGLGRFVGIVLLVRVFERDATTALAGALVGLGSAVLIGFFPARSFLRRNGGGVFDWKAWFSRVVPLSAGTGAMLFLMNSDVLFVQAHYTRDETQFYSAVAIVGVGLVTFTAPMAAVMFPKLVRSAAQSQRTNSLFLAVTGTAVLGLLGALVCSAVPWLPVRIIYHNSPHLWKSAQLVPWFMWAMLPLTLANVLVNNLLAHRNFRAVPWFVLIAIGYALEMNRYLNHAAALEMFAAYKGVILRLGLFSFVMFAVALFYSARRTAAPRIPGSNP